jgi:hypothetical protein
MQPASSSVPSAAARLKKVEGPHWREQRPWGLLPVSKSTAYVSHHSHALSPGRHPTVRLPRVFDANDAE